MSGKQAVFTPAEILSGATGTEWSATTAGAAAGATATKAAVAGIAHKVTWATFHTDKDSVLTIKDSTTVIWEAALDVSVEGLKFHVTFPTPLIGTAGNAMTANVVSSTGNCQASFGGISEKAN